MYYELREKYIIDYIIYFILHNPQIWKV